MSIQQKLQAVREATELSYLIDDQIRNQVLADLAIRLEQNIPQIIAANQLDLAKMAKDDPKYDRLLLTAERIEGLARDVLKIANSPSPLNKVLEERVLANGLTLKKVTVPLGVVAVIYEARPNVTIDVFALCFKSGNGAVLKGGREAIESNQILVRLIEESLANFSLSNNLLYLLPSSHDAVYEVLNAVGLVDVCIPRGSQNLIKFVRENAKIPVIETGAGIVHNYFDNSADLAIGQKIIFNAKTRRVSVCNALDTLLIHHQRLSDLANLVSKLATKNVTIFADQASYDVLAGNYPQKLLCHATENSFGQEFLDYKMSIKTVSSLEDAILHIRKYTSGHSEAIIANDQQVINKFITAIDVAVIYINASTAFTDAGEFEMGAEIGISTQKLHARGPMALLELTSYKWLAWGNGQIR